MARKLLLISNSTLYGSGYLDHCESQIKEFLNESNVSRVTFIPYARPSGKTHEEYTEIAKERFNRMGLELEGIGETDTYASIHKSEAIFIGGGNTFVLLGRMYYRIIMEEIKSRVRKGLPYIGTSAGSNVAGKTIMTTNDMPIVHPPYFEALGLVPFIINPHYQDKMEIPNEARRRFSELLEKDPGLAPLSILNHYIDHQGETRETRIKEYHVFNDDIVVGLREGAMLHIVDESVTLKGSSGARIFRKGQEPTEHQPGESLEFLLKG